MWEAKVTTLVCLSTAEAEYFAAVHAAKSALYIVHLVAEITSTPCTAVIIYEDNAAWVQITINPVVSACNQHFVM